MQSAAHVKHNFHTLSRIFNWEPSESIKKSFAVACVPATPVRSVEYTVARRCVLIRREFIAGLPWTQKYVHISQNRVNYFFGRRFLNAMIISSGENLANDFEFWIISESLFRFNFGSRDDFQLKVSLIQTEILKRICRKRKFRINLINLDKISEPWIRRMK